MNLQIYPINILLLCFYILNVSSIPQAYEYNCSLEIGNKPKDSLIGLKSLQLHTTDRVSHQIVTRIFAIFLREVLGFTTNLTIFDLKTQKTDNEYWHEYLPLGVLDGRHEAAVNLQVWKTIVPNRINLNLDNVIQGNPLTLDIFRYGLYIPKVHSSKSYSYLDFIHDSKDVNNTISNFHIKDNLMNEYILKNLEVDEKVSIYKSKYCQNTQLGCATVLTSHETDTGFFKKHIKLFNLRMNVYFLGSNLASILDKLLSKENIPSQISKNLNLKTTRFLVLHWNNSEIIDDSYQSVLMPPCEIYANNETVCRYDTTPVSIYYNTRVPHSLAEVLNKIEIDSLTSVYEYYRIVEKKAWIFTNETFPGTYKKNKTQIYDEVACKWLQHNPEVYNNTYVVDKKSWVPPPNLQENKIILAALLPATSEEREYKGSLAAIEMIKNYLEEYPDTLQNYKLEIEVREHECKPDLALKSLISIYQKRDSLIGVIGPSCSEAIEPMAAITKHYKLSVITSAAEGISFEDRENYPYFYRTIGETKLYEQVYEKLLTKWNWKRIFTITEDGMKYTKYITQLESRMKQKDNSFWFVNKKFSRDNDIKRNYENFKNQLNELKEKNNARIIIADVHDHNLMRLIMCASVKLEMTAESGYVWFLPVYVTLKINDTIASSTTNATLNECSDLDLQKAMKNHFTFSYSSFGDENSLTVDGSTVKEWSERYMTQRGFEGFNYYDDYGGFTYDAIWVYIKAIQTLIKADESNTSEYKFMKNLEGDHTMANLSRIIDETDFSGVSGQVKFIKGSRLIDINILQWQNNKFIKVGTYQSEAEQLSLKDNKIIWPNHQLPNDGRESCAFLSLANAFNMDCQGLQMVLIILACFIVILVISLIIFWLWKRKYDKILDETKQIMSNYGIVVNGIELIEKEIPRERVVINRRLGEGAFGTVYGGEALINDAEGWQAVAVKTLKPGASVDNRLDFLAESDSMKKFDHKNIVKLLGVCLQKEPLYAIMEFMLYGDLKTYLLARRDLVNENRISDDSDISPKKLTLMALDVARGLSYLASLKYVHRDIACRNCMINAQRIVKIGDFGMARNTFDKEYYPFGRNSMLPIRWMAVETFNDGKFSHASDMWSYAVLLFEIITLGGFPFQGLSNHQVLATVRTGGHINIPDGCKPQLQAIMKSCFNHDPTKRPTASTIVEFISNYPRMLTPCMDVPKPNINDQVNLIDDKQETDIDMMEFEEQISDRGRSHTPINKFDILKTSCSTSALQTSHQQSSNMHENDDNGFEYLPMNMNINRRPNDMFLKDFNPDLTSALPNRIYNPIEPLLTQRQEISKSNNSLMRYMPMSKGKNRNLHLEECTSKI